MDFDIGTAVKILLYVSLTIVALLCLLALGIALVAVKTRIASKNPYLRLARYSWLKARRTRTGRRLTSSGVGIGQGILMLLVFAITAYWLNGLAHDAWTMLKSIPFPFSLQHFLWLGGIIIVVGALYGYSTTQGGNLRQEKYMWILLAIVGVIVFHWLFWAIHPDAWYSWFYWRAFWPMNIAILISALLLTQRGPLRYVGQVLAVLVLIGILMGTTSYLWPRLSPVMVSAAPVYVATNVRTPTSEEILAAIAECESSGEQFEADGVTPLYNSKQGSSAVGKYQIVESLHGEKAAALGHDLKTLEGNEAYARHLFSQEGTKPWEASRGCWEPKLIALGYPAPTASAIPGITTVGAAKLLIKTGAPQTIWVPQGHRWDLINPPNSGWTTGQGQRDQLGRRVQVFEVADGVSEVELVNKITSCAHPQDCTWSK